MLHLAIPKHTLWARGLLACDYLRTDQLPIYLTILRHKRPFIECSRRFGKTTSILCFVIEQLLQHPGQVCLWCEPDKNQAREIIQPEVTKVFRSAPKEMRPQWSSTDSFYWFPSTGNRENASRLKLRGINHDLGDSARGAEAHIIVADEYGFWKDPGYVIREALAPQLKTTGGWLIKASTPPEDLGHPYYAEKQDAMTEDRFVRRIIWDEKDLDPKTLADIVADCKGQDTPAFKREYLCEPVSDPERLVIPEYDPSRHDCKNDKERPKAFDSYVGLDFGVSDHTAALFGYVDFLKRTIVIEDELFVNGRNTRQITEEAKAIEGRLWGNVKPYGRWGDNELQTIIDMHQLHGYTVSATEKHDKMDWINQARLLFQEGRVQIHERCQHFRFQLKAGLWNEKKTDFLRGERTGHLDLVAAFIYLIRNINWAHNPYPPDPGVSIYTHLTTAISSQPKEERALEDALNPIAAGDSWT